MKHADTPLYPEVVVMLGDLSGPAGNAFFIMGAVRGALKDAGVGEPALTAYSEESREGNYKNLLTVADTWVNAFVLDGLSVLPLAEYIEEMD